MVSCGIISVCIGKTTFKCLFSGLDYTFVTCETPAYENAFYLYFRVSVALDIITDALSEWTFNARHTNGVHTWLERCKPSRSKFALFTCIPPCRLTPHIPPATSACPLNSGKIPCTSLWLHHYILLLLTCLHSISHCFSGLAPVGYSNHLAQEDCTGRHFLARRLHHRGHNSQ